MVLLSAELRCKLTVAALLEWAARRWRHCVYNRKTTVNIPRPLRSSLLVTVAAAPYLSLLVLAVFSPPVEIDLKPRETYRPAVWVMAPIEVDQGGEDDAPEGAPEAVAAAEPAPAPAPAPPPVEPAKDSVAPPTGEVHALLSPDGVALANVTVIDPEEEALQAEIDAARELLDAEQEALADAEAADGDDEIPRIDRRPLKPRKPIARGARNGKDGAQAKASAKKGPRCVEPTPGIVQISDEEFEIDAAIVEFYSHDLYEASKLAYVSWAYNEAEEIIGFKVRRIRCGSPLWQAGLRNGDIITSVNGRTITTIPQAFKVYRKLRKKDSFRLEVDRKGETLKFKYKLV